MILSDRQISEGVLTCSIVIDPFDQKKLNPNSYNVTLAPELLRVLPNSGQSYYDIAKPAKTENLFFSPAGILLMPGVLYLGRTNEVAGSRRYVPMIEGRSSIGRCGIFVHITAGFGDKNFVGTWTLEICVVMPTMIYPNIEIGQVFFHEIKQGGSFYNGQYNGQKEIRTSGIWKEINNAT
jgi:dCTP deaminase